MRLPSEPRLPEHSPMARQLTDLFRQIAVQVNQLSEGLITARYGALTAAPTTGDWNQGDFIANSAPTELGVAGSKFVIHGWQCVASGTPGTWVQCCFLTGN